MNLLNRDEGEGGDRFCCPVQHYLIWITASLSLSHTHINRHKYTRAHARARQGVSHGSLSCCLYPSISLIRATVLIKRNDGCHDGKCIHRQKGDNVAPASLSFALSLPYNLERNHQKCREKKWRTLKSTSCQQTNAYQMNLL